MIELGSFLTEDEPCAYLAGRESRHHMRLVFDVQPEEYSTLLAQGWRRFGAVVFRPVCVACQECVPIRIPIEGFRPSKSQRRVLRKNADVTIEVGEPAIDDERLELYRRHHAEREEKRGWNPSGMDYSGFRESFVLNAANTLEFRYRIDGRLVGIAYVGEASDAFNSIYAFFDPEFAKRGLGKLDVLCEIEEAERRGKNFLYLGFLVDDCISMSYKSSFRPHELLRGGEWVEGPHGEGSQGEGSQGEGSQGEAK